MTNVPFAIESFLFGQAELRQVRPKRFSHQGRAVGLEFPHRPIGGLEKGSVKDYLDRFHDVESNPQSTPRAGADSDPPLRPSSFTKVGVSLA